MVEGPYEDETKINRNNELTRVLEEKYWTKSYCHVLISAKKTTSHFLLPQAALIATLGRPAGPPNETVRSPGEGVTSFAVIVQAVNLCSLLLITVLRLSRIAKLSF